MVQKNCIKNKVVFVCGPTASGKSDLAVSLAKKLEGEIIGADSVQMFQGLNIGSGKITSKEKQNIPHHMIDILQPHQEYSVSDYVKATDELIKEIQGKGKIPIVTGGTGLYIKTLIEGYNFAHAAKDEAIRNKYKKLLNEKGSEFIHNQLKSIDPLSAEKISQFDTKRLIRALEIFEITGIPKSKIAQASANPRFDFDMIILSKEREQLYRDINARVDKMIQQGLVAEVEGLLEFKDCQSMQAIGYKEIVRYLQDNTDLQVTIDEIKQNTRRYAKRQLTFFRGLKYDSIWLNNDGSDLVQKAISYITRDYV